MFRTPHRPAPAQPRTVLAVAALLAAAAFTPLTATPAHADTLSPSGVPMPGDLPGWRVTAADDFNETTLNTAVWGAYEGVPGGSEGGRWKRSHVVLADGKVRLENYVENGVLTTGGMSRARAGGQTYGRYDTRFRIDKAAGIGYAILLYPSSGGWPPEIDIAEDAGGARTKTTSTLHYGSANYQIGLSTQADFSQWHTVSVVWSPARLEYFLDGVSYGVTNSAMVPAEPMWLGWQTQQKRCVAPSCTLADQPTFSAMEIDWTVRYTYDPSTDPNPAVSPAATLDTSTSSTAAPAVLVSVSPSRLNSVPLAGQTITGNVFVHAQPASSVSEVTFFLDDPATAPGVRPNLVGSELTAPYDLKGGLASEANAWDVSTLSPGNHTLYVRTIDSTGQTELAVVPFTVGTTSTIPPSATANRLTAVQLSTAATRTNPVPLDGATVTGPVYVTAVPNMQATSVSFYLDDMKTAASPFTVEWTAPYDAMGGSTTLANPWNISALAIGPHTLTVRTMWKDGYSTTVHSTFTKS